MMDIQNEVVRAQAFTGATTVGLHSYQKASAAQDISIGRRMALLVYFHLAGAGTTHTLDAIQSTVTALTAPDILSTVVITTAALPADKFVEVPIPAHKMTKLHLGMQHAAAGGTTTATISAWLVPQDEISKYKSFVKVVDAEV